MHPHHAPCTVHRAPQQPVAARLLVDGRARTEIGTAFPRDRARRRNIELVRTALIGALLILSVATALPAQNVRTVAAAREGWAAIRDGRHEAAAAAFADALRDAPREPTLHFGAGLAAHLLGEPSRARIQLEEALRLAPEYTDASLLLGEVLYRSGTIEDAIRVYEAALAHAQGEPTLSKRLAQWRDEAALHRDFFQTQSSHFTVLFEGTKDEALASKAVELLESAYWRVGSALSTFPDGSITVVLYTEQQFRDVTRSPDWAAAAYDGRIRIPVRGALNRVEEFDRVLTHEFTHALVRTIAPSGVPTWLNEGLAVAFEPHGSEWTRAQLASTTSRVPGDKLSRGFAGFSGTDARLAYAQSASAVQQLLDRPGPAALVALLQDIARGDRLASAFEYRMLMPYGDFLASLHASTPLGVR